MIYTTHDLPEVSGKPRDPYKPKRTTPKASTFVISFLVVLLIALFLPEGIFEFIRMGGQECSKPDLITGFIHLKNKRITWTQEGYSSGSTNSMGFLDYEHKLAKPAGVCRIAMLGDSMTESLQVAQESRFSNLLEKRLNKLYPGRFEVFNFGVSAAGTGQELLTYLRYVEQFRPDITILFFDSGDEDKNGRKPFMAPWHAHVVFGLENGRLTANWQDFDAWLHSAQAIPVALFEPARTKSHLWGALIQGMNSLKVNDFSKEICASLERLHLLEPMEDSLVACLPVSRFGPPEFRVPQSEIYLQRNEFCSKYGLVCTDSPDAPIARFNEADFEFGREPEFHTRHLTKEQCERLDRRDRERWQLTRAILTRLAAECKCNGSTFVVAGFPALPLQTGFESAFSQVNSLVDGNNSYAVNLTKSFYAAAHGKDKPRFVAHLSETGHEIMTDVLFQSLMQRNLLSKWTQPQAGPVSEASHLHSE